MNAIILSVGDELVLGQTVDTNSAWLSAKLASLGCGVAAHVTVPDEQSAIERAIRESAARCDVLLISGGLGPTEDDLTRPALAHVMAVPLEINSLWLAELENFFAARGRPMPASNRIQAMIPRGAEMIFNTAGTASGIHAVLPSALASESSPNCQIFVMPGVPKEMKAMFERDVLLHVRASGGGAVILSQTLHTFGLGESAVGEKLGKLMHRGRNPSVGTTISGGVVSLRVNARFASAQEAQHRLDETSDACRELLGNLIYGQDDQTLGQVIGEMLKSASGAPNVATAESCTGGLLGKMLTDVPGSSAYYTYGWVTYANRAKEQQLGVPSELLQQHGAVSEPVVIAMANGARQHSGSTYALAISGIAGPDGGTPDKPVGTVCIALASPEGCAARTFLFPGDREMIRDRSAKMALMLLRYHLLGEKPPF